MAFLARLLAVPVVTLALVGCTDEDISAPEEPSTTTTEATTTSSTSSSTTTTSTTSTSTTTSTTEPPTTTTEPATTTTTETPPRGEMLVTAADLEDDWPLTVPPPVTLRCERVEHPDYDPADVATLSVVDPDTGTEQSYYLGHDGPDATAAGSDLWLLPLADEIRDRYGNLTELTEMALDLC